LLNNSKSTLLILLFSLNLPINEGCFEYDIAMIYLKTVVDQYQLIN